MEAHSELDRFLAAQRDDGRAEESGQFTIAREKALEKLAGFGLPFKGAWAVKIIQFIVSTGTVEPIKVDLLSRETQFFFLANDFDLDRLESAFFNPDHKAEAGLGNLLSALWAVGVGEGRPFQVSLPGAEQSLLWDGKSLMRAPSSTRYDCAFIAVSHTAPGSGFAGWINRMAASGSSNADTLSTLAERCFPCPVPLTVDGRRMDALQFCPGHGWGKGTFPLTVGFADCDLPPLRIPDGTYSGMKLPPRSFSEELFDSTAGSLDQAPTAFGEKAFKELERVWLAPAPFLVTAHMRHVGSGKNSRWEDSEGPSIIYWVCHGAVVEQESVSIRQYYCSVGCFLDATGLPTDLSGFNLRKLEERARRRKVLLKSLPGALRSLDSIPFEALIQENKSKTRVKGTLGLVVGTGLMFVNPFFGFALLGAGAISCLMAGTETAGRAVKLRNAITDLALHLETVS